LERRGTGGRVRVAGCGGKSYPSATALHIALAHSAGVTLPRSPAHRQRIASASPAHRQRIAGSARTAKTAKTASAPRRFPRTTPVSFCSLLGTISGALALPMVAFLPHVAATLETLVASQTPPLLKSLASPASESYTSPPTRCPGSTHSRPTPPHPGARRRVAYP